ARLHEEGSKDRGPRHRDREGEAASSGAGEDRAMKVRITPSTGNVFRDIGFSEEEAEHLKIRSDLMILLQRAISRRHLKQAEVARILGVTQPRVSDLVRGRIGLFSIDTLVDFLARFGIHVKVVVSST